MQNRSSIIGGLSSPSNKIAKHLLDIGAVKLSVQQPFTWTSGIKSPIYCDNRIINSNVAVRDAVIDAFIELIQKYIPQTDIIAAVANGGIPYGILIADRLKLPFIYVSKERKKYGLEKIIEGEYQPGQRVVLIEDHISLGGSSMKAIDTLQDEGLELISLLSIMTYSLQRASDLYASKGITHESICNLDTILIVAEQEGIITSDEAGTILRFRQSPESWHP